MARKGNPAYLLRMESAGNIIKLDAEIARIREKLKDKQSAKLQSKLDELLKARADLLAEMEKQARKDRSL